MYAVRRKDGVNKPFRVGERAYEGAYWMVETSLTGEHEFAAAHGALQIVEVSDFTDPQLMPFPVQNPATLGDIVTQPSLADLQTEVERLTGAVAEREMRIVHLESQVLALEGQTHAHEAEIARLQRALEGVQTSVATFSAPESTPLNPPARSDRLAVVAEASGGREDGNSAANAPH
jgi:hypothetical protein